MDKKTQSAETASKLADLVVGMTYPEWSRAKFAIERTYDRHKAQVRLTDKEELVGAIESEISW